MKTIGRDATDGAQLCYADWLWKKMNRRNLSIKRLSIMTGIPAATIGYILAGKRVAGVEVFGKLKSFFKVNVGHSRKTS